MPLIHQDNVYLPAVLRSLNTMLAGAAKSTRVATAAALPNSPTYSYPNITAGANAALVIDGVTIAVGDLVLVTQQATASQNGLYACTVAGSGSAPWSLARSIAMSVSADLSPAALFMTGPEGAANANATFMLTSTAPLTLDSSNLTFTKVASALEGAAPLATFTKSAADGTAATTTAETVLGAVGSSSGGAIGLVQFIPAAALTFNASNFATIQVQKRTAGGAAVTVAQLATSAASWTQWAPVTIPIIAAAVSAGDALTFNIGKSGTGVVVPAGQINVWAS